MEDIKAFVFDMDGILLDTESICDRTWRLAAEKMGVKTDTDFINACRGTSYSDACKILKDLLGKNFDAEKFMSLTLEYFYKIEKEEGLPLMPYAKEILEYLKPKYRLALASSTKGEAVRRQLTNAGLIEYFDSIVTGDRVKHSKPDPEIYILACASLGIEPKNCFAVEDSPNGIKSANAAGLNVIMVPDQIQPDKATKSLCKHVFTSLKEIESIC